MPRDQILKKAFEIADDGMQGVVGYFYYVVASQHIAKEQIIIDYLPRVPVLQNGSIKIQYRMQMFHEWDRYYNPAELIETMTDVFIPYHIRTCLLSIVSIFEAYLSHSIDRLVKKGKIRSVKRGYRNRLGWVFPIIRTSTYGNNSMQNRRPKLCLDIDHARRIRNLWMHNNGNINRIYKSDVIKIPKQKPIIVSDYQQFAKSPRSKVPLHVDIDMFNTISRSHIEALHHINHMLQVLYFGQKQSYGYVRENKKIEWNRLLYGV